MGRPDLCREARQGSLHVGSLPLNGGERAGNGREIARETCRLYIVSYLCAKSRYKIRKMTLTIENIVVALLFNLGAERCRYRGVRSVVVGNTPVTPLRWLPAHDVAAFL